MFRSVVKCVGKHLCQNHRLFMSASSVIKSVMPLLSAADKFLLPLCDAKGGADNLDRLTGEYCTVALGQGFTWGVEDRFATVR